MGICICRQKNYSIQQQNFVNAHQKRIRDFPPALNNNGSLLRFPKICYISGNGKSEPWVEIHHCYTYMIAGSELNLQQQLRFHWHLYLNCTVNPRILDYTNMHPHNNYYFQTVDMSFSYIPTDRHISLQITFPRKFLVESVCYKVHAYIDLNTRWT
jgi:hypothetical protein